MPQLSMQDQRIILFEDLTTFIGLDPVPVKSEKCAKENLFLDIGRQFRMRVFRKKNCWRMGISNLT